MSADPFAAEYRRAVDALAHRIRERDRSDDPLDPELVALEFLAALRARGWRPVEALQPAQRTSGGADPQHHAGLLQAVRATCEQASARIREQGRQPTDTNRSSQ